MNPCENEYNCLFCFLFLLQKLVWWVPRAVDGSKGRSEIIIVSGHLHWQSPVSLQGCREHLQPCFPSSHCSFGATLVVIVVANLKKSINVSWKPIRLHSSAHDKPSQQNDMKCFPIGWALPSLLFSVYRETFHCPEREGWGRSPGFGAWLQLHEKQYCFSWPYF